jgi:divinyl chlorophyllide a 8-vinyl-reductase
MSPPPPQRILLLGATGTIGRAVLAELLQRGHDVTCILRDRRHIDTSAKLRVVNVNDPASVLRDGFQNDHFDAVISTMASRTGAPRDTWAIDHQAHINVLKAAQHTGVKLFILLSAICVQKPKLAFQRAKLAFEADLIKSGMTHSIIRPTAYFKSLSGQVARVKAGKPFLLFGDGNLTSCKPISDRDLARYIVNCLDDPAKHNAILPIGGPGPAQTPRQQGEQLFALLQKPPRFRHVPLALMDSIIAGLSVGGRILPRLADKAELARIGRYYATESMLVWDAAKQHYDAHATPEFGEDRLIDYHAKLLSGEATVNLGDHAMF